MGLNTKRFSADRQLLGIQLAQLGERSSREILAVMRDEAEKIRDLARDFAPRDENELEQAIVILPETRDGINNRTVIHVGVDEGATNSRGTPIWWYGMMMHEGLAPYGAGIYQLAEGSRQKDAGRGIVGGKFIDRAVKSRIGEIGKRIKYAANRSFS